MAVVLEFQNISFNYPKTERGLKELSFSIEKGHRVVVLGLNGAGKSTLFLTLCGINRPQKGKYLLKGKEFKYSLKERRNIGRTIGYLFQDPEVQLFASTVWEDIAFGLRNYGYNELEVSFRVQKYLELLSLEDVKDRPPHELSYGQKKLVALAGILVMEPEIIILDEPFAWLDNKQEAYMLGILEKLNQQGMTLLISTHNMNFALSWANYSIVLEQGEVIYATSSDALLQKSYRLRKMGFAIP